MKILIITDIHYGEDTNHLKCGGENYINSFGSQFDSFLSRINDSIKKYDLVINLGDLIHEVTTESDLVNYKNATMLFGKKRPVKHVVGNHELTTLSRDQLAEIIGEKNIYYSFDLNGYHHVILGIYRNSKDELFKIDEEQIIWLKKNLNKTKLPTLVYCHYPLDNQNIESNYYFSERPDKAFIKNKEEVRSIMESSKKVLAVFNGHLHFFNQENIDGIIYVTVPSFTENNGKNKPKAEYLEVEMEANKIEISVNKLA